MNIDEPTGRSGQPSRRRFLRGGAQGLALFGIGGALGWLTPRAGARETLLVQFRGGSRKLGKEYEYNLGNLGKTDPKLVLYEQTSQFATGLKEMREIALDSTGAIYLAGDRLIRRFDSSGARQRDIAVDAPPRSLAVHTDGNLFFGQKDAVTVYAADGAQKARWEPVKGAVFTSIAISQRDVFVADAGNRVVLRYDLNGRLIARLGKKDASRHVPGFVVPSPYFDLTIGGDGSLWVANPGQHRVEAYTFERELQSFWGEPANGIKGFCGCCNPAHFAILPDGRFVTSEKGLARVKIYSAKGDFEGVVAGSEQFPGYLDSARGMQTALPVAADARGRVLVADSLASQVRIFTPKPASMS